MNRSAIPVLALLVGCLSEDEQQLRTWEGVYRFTRVTENTESCADEGLEIELQHRFFELDSVAGEEAHLVELRACDSEASCDPVGFATWIAPEVTGTRLDGTNDEVFFTVVGEQGGLCQAMHQEMAVSRTSAAKGDLSVTVYSAIATDVVAPSEAICLDLLGEMARDPDGCDALRVYEGKKVE